MTSFAIHQSTPMCLARLKAQREGAQSDAPHWRFGSAMHEVCEAMTIASARGEDLPIAARAALHRWQQGDRPLTPKQHTEALELVEQMNGEGYWLKFHVPGRGRACRVEWGWALDAYFNPVLDEQGEFVQVERDKPCDPRVAYSGTFDRVDWPTEADRGPVVLRDLKSTIRWVKAEEIVSDLQARIYCLALLSLWPQVDGIVFDLVLIRQDRKVSHTFKRGEPWMEQTRAVMRARRDRVLLAQETDEWPAEVGEDCDGCPIQNVCSRYAEMVSAPLAPSNLSDDALGRGCVTLKAIAAKYDREARKRAEHGPLPLPGGKALGYTASERDVLAFTAREVYEDLIVSGATPEMLDEMMPGGPTKKNIRAVLDKLAKKGEHVLDPKEDLKGFYKKVAGQTFRVFTDYPDK